MTQHPATDLPRTVHFQIAHTLRTLLPPPVTDDQDAALQRDLAAVAKVAALGPANAMEVDFAAQAVAANAHAADVLRQAVAAGADDAKAMKCRAQAICMMRQAQSAMRTLMRMQADRRKLETAADGSADRASWSEHIAAQTMAEAMIGGPATLVPPPAPPTPEPEPELPEAPPTPTAEEDYAMNYPDRAALIRRHGRIPDGVTFGPPDDELVQALLASTSPIVLAVDQRVARR